jgi:chemotaxis family two-component system response regulator Rcp1
MRKHRVLIVEDRPADVRLTKRALKKAGYDVEVDVAENGRQALDHLNNGKPKPDLVLLDWMMPLVNGEQVLDEMRTSPTLRRMPVVVLTTSASEGDVATAYDKGCNAYLTKPVDPAEFQKTIEAMGLFWLEQVVLPEP